MTTGNLFGHHVIPMEMSAMVEVVRNRLEIYPTTGGPVMIVRDANYRGSID